MAWNFFDRIVNKEQRPRFRWVKHLRVPSVFKDNSGATAIELIIALIIIACLTILSATGTSLSCLFNTIARSLGIGAGGRGSGCPVR